MYSRKPRKCFCVEVGRRKMVSTYGAFDLKIPSLDGWTIVASDFTRRDRMELDQDMISLDGIRLGCD